MAHGGTPPSLHLQRAYKMLKDEQWHDYNQVLVAVAALVHPSTAYRRVRSRRRTEPAGEEARAAAVRTGQREIARIALGRKDRFEHREVKGIRQIRLISHVELTPEQRSMIRLKGWATRRKQAKG